MKATAVFLMVLAVLILAVGQASSSIIRVKWDSPTDGPGNDWDHAYHTVTAGLNAAASGDEVWVAGDVGHPYIERITLVLGVGLYGGFAGDEIERAQRSFRSNVTILDGNQGGAVVTCPADATPATLIDGFTIRNGTRGVSCVSCSPVVCNSILAGNSSTSIYLQYSSAVVSRNTMVGNYAGVLCHTSSTPLISNNIIQSNNEYGIVCVAGAYPRICNNTVVSNGGVGLGWTVHTGGTAANNIVAFNSRGVNGSVAGAGRLTCNNVYGNTVYDYNDVSPGTGDISIDPLFIDRVSGDYHLSLLSPCINSGYNAKAPPGLGDIDGESRILPEGGTVDIGADEYSAHAVWSPAEARKLAPEGQTVYLTSRGAMVTTARFDEMPAYYVEKSDRTSGIQCRGESLLTTGQAGVIYGEITTLEGERILTNAAVVPGSLSTATVPSASVMGNFAIGGGAFGLQEGIASAFGLNNIGLLVQTFGRVQEIESVTPPVLPTWFKIDDGSGVNLKCVVPSGAMIDEDWDYVVVTGISSCEKVGEELRRLLRVRTQDDIVLL